VETGECARLDSMDWRGHRTDRGDVKKDLSR